MEARFTTYETISAKACPMYLKLKFQQAKRRQETLEIQKQYVQLFYFLYFTCIINNIVY